MVFNWHAWQKNECLWRIGDGSRLNIWENPWIPRAWSRRVITPIGASLLTHVNELICPIFGNWDEQLALDTFWPDDARHILQIPLWEGVDDFVAWHFDSKGEHWVKSAYKIHVQLAKKSHNGGPGCSSTEAGQLERQGDQSWLQIWEMTCPRKIQMFIWRMKHELLAPCTNLQNRGLKLEETKKIMWSSRGGWRAPFHKV